MTSKSPSVPEIASDIGNFTIHSRMEIIHILRAIQNKTELVTAYFNQGQDFLLTSIVDVDAANEILIFDYGINEQLNQRIQESGRIILVTMQDKVKVQFVIEQMQVIQYQGRPAFQAKLPDNLIRLQRREYYRLATPIVKPIKCLIIKPNNSKIEAPIANISLGGMAITHYQDQTSLTIGDRLDTCRVALPEIGTLSTGIEIRNEQEIIMPNGARNRRADCMFINLPPNQQAMIQRYITKLERERLSRLAQ